MLPLEPTEYQPSLLDPNYDDVPEELPVFLFTPLDGGAPFTVFGVEARDQTVVDMDDDGVPFTVQFTGEYGLDPDAVI